MTQSNADRQRAYRDRKRGGPPRALQPCGTVAAARRHERAGEPLCEPCRRARAEAAARHRRRRKATQTAATTERNRP